MKISDLPVIKSSRFSGECRDVTTLWKGGTLDVEGLADVSKRPDVALFLKDRVMGVPGPLAIFEGEGSFWFLVQDKAGGPFDTSAVRLLLNRKERLSWHGA